MKIDKFYLVSTVILLSSLIIFWPIRRSFWIFDQNLSLFSLKPSFPKDTERLNYQRQLPILMYHYIREPNLQESNIGRNLSISPGALKKQLQIIESHGLKTATLAELTKNRILAPSVILTFDDGYTDFYTNAWPILKKYGARATVFIITDRIDQPGYLTANQIQTLSSQNIEIGSHSVSHPNLTNASDLNVQKQLEDSKSEIESIIAKEVTSFSYPSGKYDERIINAVFKAGYRSAVTTDSAAILLDDYNLYSLPRLRVKETIDLERMLDELNL